MSVICRSIIFLVFLLVSIVIGCTPHETQPFVPNYTYRVINRFTHDINAFTEGLVYQDGFLYESTGLNGESSLRKVDLLTGEILQVYRLPEQYFGEGITIWKDRVIQLTWQTQVGFVYNKVDFDLISEFSYATEGWGLTHDDSRLIMSDGSSTLFFMDPYTLKPAGHIDVHDGINPVDKINELEYVDGKIFANIWMTDKIAIIDPKTGDVTGWLDLPGILPPQSTKADVLNGIAYDEESDRLFVTGKWWPYLYEIKMELR